MFASVHRQAITHGGRGPRVGVHGRRGVGWWLGDGVGVGEVDQFGTGVGEEAEGVDVEATADHGALGAARDDRHGDRGRFAGGEGDGGRFGLGGGTGGGAGGRLVGAGGADLGRRGGVGRGGYAGLPDVAGGRGQGGVEELAAGYGGQGDRAGRGRARERAGLADVGRPQAGRDLGRVHADGRAVALGGGVDLGLAGVVEDVEVHRLGGRGGHGEAVGFARYQPERDHVGGDRQR